MVRLVDSVSHYFTIHPSLSHDSTWFFTPRRLLSCGHCDPALPSPSIRSSLPTLFLYLSVCESTYCIEDTVARLTLKDIYFRIHVALISDNLIDKISKFLIVSTYCEFLNFRLLTFKIYILIIRNFIIHFIICSSND